MGSRGIALLVAIIAKRDATIIIKYNMFFDLFVSICIISVILNCGYKSIINVFTLSGRHHIHPSNNLDFQAIFLRDKERNLFEI